MVFFSENTPLKNSFSIKLQRFLTDIFCPPEITIFPGRALFLGVLLSVTRPPFCPTGALLWCNPMTHRTSELIGISDKLVAWATSGDGALDEEEERLLHKRYIHLSANWNAGVGKGGSTLDVIFINAPAERERARHADIPGESTR